MAESILQMNLLQVVLGSYLQGAATAIQDPKILPDVQQYKRLVASQLMPLAKQDITRKIPDSELFVSRKIDGEFNVVIWSGNEVFSVNPGGTVRIGLPVFEELKSIFNSLDIESVKLIGELYIETETGDRCRIHDVNSLLRHPNNEDELQRVRFAVFDIIELAGQRIEKSYSDKWKLVQSWFANGQRVQPVETKVVQSNHAVVQIFNDWVEKESAEGIVVRSDLIGNFKIKPLHTIDAVVIGFTESTDDRSGMMHDLLLAVRRKDGAYHVLCRVGGGFSEELRRQFLSDLKDIVVESEYAEVNSDHVAYQMVRPELVVEVSCLDLVAQNTRGKPVNRMTLNWDNESKIYRVGRRLPLVSVISPQFLRVREDKVAENIADTRIQQIDTLVPIPMVDVETTELTLPKSQLMQREVYVKTLRGEKLVRKFLLWKTNKENESENFPAFVAYHADFSPTRKVPLTREVRVSNSETQILALWHQLKEENVKQGWELFGVVSDDVDAIALKADSVDGNTGTTKTVVKSGTKEVSKKKKVSKKADGKKKKA